ncbi:WD repeat-containing protein 90 [Mus musculus]|uniref:WD repeat-containing protein 90 n=1 Tax=Mus musculus TaxID=10090 RepID=H7BX49_MOUSE|nr:WD repeat-containing protein 90 [Mus musculus]|eukprot:NP_001157238.1 WD repeat-containing protein 90 [Mus musculus]
MAGGSGARETRCRQGSRPGSPGSEVPAASVTGPRAEARPAGGGGGSRRAAPDRCSGGVPSAAWQHPFLNVFRHFRVDEWKRSSKEGDVAVVTDKVLKSAVYRIRGSVSASNYIQLPRTSTQSLGLTGRYLYVLFRPVPTKHFVIHLDVSTEDGQVIRVSFSNLFKEFKSSTTWLQFPFVFETKTPRRGGDIWSKRDGLNEGLKRDDLAGVALPRARWTCLQLDLRDILMFYLGRHYSHLKSIRLCASLLVRNLYTSDLCFDPAVTVTEARRAKLSVNPMPREMAFPVPKGESWHDNYIHVRFPSDCSKVPDEQDEKSCSPPEAVFLGRMSRHLPHPGVLGKPLLSSKSPVAQACSSALPCQVLSASSRLPEVSRTYRYREVSSVSASSIQSQRPSVRDEVPDAHTVSGERHVLADRSSGVPMALEDIGSCRLFLPDPVLRLKGVIGFGGHSTQWALWTKDGVAVVYPCHAVIIVLQIDTGQQRFFLGHTDKVSALALNGSDTLLASAQVQPPSMVRLWDFQTGSCLSLFRSPLHTICSLSFSGSGALLCGVGKDRHGRTVVVAWSTEQAGLGGEVVVLAKVHTDFDIRAFQVAFFDETRMASCGRGSVRLWRLRGGVLRSCAVDLGEYCSLELTDLAFAQALDGHCAPSAGTLFVCSHSGHILEIDHQRMSVQHVRRLLPARSPGAPLAEKQNFSVGSGIAISSLSVSTATCAVGSEDGYLRLWPLDFSSVLLEAEHDGPVSSVSFSPDGLRVLSTTTSGHLGFLDVPSREYTVLARSHMAPVLALSTEPNRGQMATVSLDHTVRIWDLATLQQLYDFSSSEDTPCAVAFHPTMPNFFCGFSSGAVRSFSLESSGVLVEHTRHRGAITSLVITLDGRFLFSSCSQGSLVQYSCADSQCCVLRVAANMVCQDGRPNPNILAVSGDSCRLAFVGPSKCMVTIVESASLDELLRVDVSTLNLASNHLDWAVAICFSPGNSGHLLVSTSSNKVVVLDAVSGHTLRELSSVRSRACCSLALSEDAHLLLAATDRTITVWDYPTQANPSCQVYIGHSEPVHAVAFTPDQLQVISVGDAIFLWDILATPERDGGDHEAPPGHEAGSSSGQLDDLASGASGLPRQQVPIPFQALPPPLSSHDRLLDGSTGTFSTSDEEGLCEENHVSEALLQGQAPTPHVLVDREASGAGDAPRETAGSSWTPAERPSPHSHMSEWSLRSGKAGLPTRPDSYKHFTPRYKTSPRVKSVYFPPIGRERLRLKAIVGYNGNGRANMVWRPDTGFFAYTCGRLVVVEDLHSGTQRHWLGHSQEISTLALNQDGQILASASCCGNTAARCQIRIWDVPKGLCRHLLSHHDTAVQALAFSPDDEFLVTLGDYADRNLALWSMATYELLSSTRLLEPVHGVAFNPWDANELICVGTNAITFWLLQHHGADTCFQVHREPIPEELGASELTSLCYGASPLLYCGSSSGQVCVWDTGTGHCFLAWEADDGEIGVLLCSGSRLISGSNTKRLRLWAVGVVPELRRKGSSARSSSVFMERELTLDGAVVSASFDSGMDMGVVGTTAGTIWYISWTEGTSTRLISGHRTKVNEVVFSPGESHCATCGEDGSVRVWSLASMELVIQFQVLNQSCLCLAWTPPSCELPEQQQVVAGYSDGTLRVFSISRTAMELKMHPHRTALTAIAFSTDGQTILSGDKDGLVAISHPCTGMTFRVLSDHRGAPISAIQSTSKEYGDLGVEGVELWLAASGDQRVSIWVSDWLRDRCELLEWLSFPAPAVSEAPGLLPPSLAAFCPWDKAILVCVGLGAHEEVIFYSLRQKQVIQKTPLPFFAMSLSLSPGSQLMVVGFAECMMRLLDCASGTAQDLEGHDDSVHLCRFTPSGRLLFTAAHNEILVWEVTDP